MNRKFTALLLSVSLLLTACSEGQIGENVQPDASETVMKNAPMEEAAAKTEETIFTEPRIGGSAILSQDTLNGYTASLELINIQALPENEDGAYIAEQARVRVTLTDGKEFVSDLDYNMLGSADRGGVWADCAENAVKIFEVDDNGVKRYVLMVYEIYVKSRDIYKADFFSIADGLKHAIVSMDNDYTSPYWLSVSDAFAYKEGATFTDSKMCYEMTLDFEYFEANCTSVEGYDDRAVFAEPEIGGDAAFSEVSAGDCTAWLELQEIVALPTEERNVYEAAKGVSFVLADKNGSKARTGLMIGELGGQYAGGVWADCAENALQLYEIEWNGEKKYVLRGYISYGTENGTYPDADPELYHARFYVCDFDAAEGGVLRPYSINGRTDGDFYISDSLVYKGGNVLYDEKTKTELIFDPDDHSVDYVRLAED